MKINLMCATPAYVVHTSLSLQMYVSYYGLLYLIMVYYVYALPKGSSFTFSREQRPWTCPKTTLLRPLILPAQTAPPVRFIAALLEMKDSAGHIFNTSEGRNNQRHRQSTHEDRVEHHLRYTSITWLISTSIYGLCSTVKCYKL